MTAPTSFATTTPIAKPAENRPPAKPQKLTAIARVRGWQKEGAIIRIPSGFPSLDEACRGGFSVPRLVVFGGAPNGGKTTVVSNIARNAMKLGHPVGWLAADEDADDLLVRIAQLVGLERRQVEARESEALVDLERELALLPFEVFDGDESTIEEVVAWTSARAKELGKAGVVIDDSLQLGRTLRTDEIRDKREKIDDHVKTLKRLVKKERLLGIATSEIGRAFYRSVKNAEDLNDLAAFKESGGIEYQAQTAIVLRNVPDMHDMFEGATPKNRGGKKIAFRLRMDFATTRMMEAVMPNPEEEAAERAAAAQGAKDKKIREAAESIMQAIARDEGIGNRKLMKECKLGRVTLDEALDLLETTDRAENRPVRHGEREDAHWFVKRPKPQLELGGSS